MTEQFTEGRGVFNISNEDYHGANALSKSGIDLILESPHHYMDRVLNSDNYPQTASMDKGEAFHCMVLEPDRFSKTYVKVPQQFKGARSKAQKQDFHKWIEDNSEPHQSLIFESDYNHMNTMFAAIRRLKFRHLIEDGDAEMSYFTQDEETGVWLKARPDYVKETEDTRWIVDLKTSRDASPDGFAKACGNYGYHRQDAHYRDVVSQLHDDDKETFFVFVVVETGPPYSAAHYILRDDARKLGERQCREAIHTFKSCRDSESWPMYTRDIMTIDLPRYVYTRSGGSI